ncbi:MAG: caspase family protein [Epsilonproteobacteria bacterium]|nr:MAG: caspase family protein [Campylobacterota bacterium]
MKILFISIFLFMNLLAEKDIKIIYTVITKTKNDFNLLIKKNIESSQKTSKLDLDFTFKRNEHINFDSFALIIGINKYKQNTPVEYADLSALAFKELANKTLGIPKENIITLLNDEATSGQLKAKIELIKELSDRKGNIYVYFAGHGVPGKNGNTYLLPNDMSADNIHLEPNLKLDSIYAKLSKSNAKNVFVFIDSCFSGKDDSGSLLYKGVAPVLKTKKTIISGDKLTIFTAGSSTDFANDYQDKKQRMFTYFFVKELSQGATNLNNIYSKIKNKVKRKSLMKGIGYKQVPQLYGNVNKPIL